MSEYLTTREFDLYCKQDTLWKDRMDGKIDTLGTNLVTYVTQNAKVDSRLTILESYSDRHKSNTSKISAGISMVVSSAIAGIVSYFTSGGK